MKAIHRKRLQKLIDHLRQMPRENFNFEALHERSICGTVSCAIGETPCLFPKLVEYAYEFLCKDGREQYVVKSKKTGKESYDEIGAELFGISSFISYCLFTPGEQFELNLPNCRRDTPPKQVAKMLQAFLDRQSKKK